MRVLVTGAAGLLGAHLATFFARQHEVIGTDRHPWWGPQALPFLLGDLGHSGFGEKLVREVRPDLLFHCAAMASVDGCEQNPEKAYFCNGEITRRLAQALPPDGLFVYLSTDGLFRGDRPLVEETETPSPKTVYGSSKLRGEREVQATVRNHLIVRTNFYGWSSGRKKTAGEWLYQALKEQQPVTLFEDFYFSPLYVADFVERLALLIQAGGRGIYHLCGAERVSKCDFGLTLARLAGFPTGQVRRGLLREAHLPADRPQDMSLSSRRFCALTGGGVPGCAEGLRRFLDDRERPLQERLRACAEHSV